MAAPIIVAGPCSAESREQVLLTAEQLLPLKPAFFRAGLWKPRTRPGCFEGVGDKGLEWLKEVQGRFGLKTGTEVGNAAHVRACLDAGLDMVWLGARTTASPFLVQEIADALSGSNVTVLVKNPVNPDVELWSGAVERLSRAGIRDIMIVHRGFSSAEPMKYRNDPMWQLAVRMRGQYPGLPFLCDPSHIAGDSTLVGEVAQRAMDLGLDGLMVESHCDPARALSDSAQQLTPLSLASLLSSLSLRSRESGDDAFNSRLAELRARIDGIDSQIVSLLSERMQTSREIGRIKAEGHVSIIQSSRWEDVLSRAIEEGAARGLEPDFVRNLFNLIHDASVASQK